MSNVEHYFENLLLHGHDIKGEPNKNALSKEVQDAIEQCAYYIKYTYFRKDPEEEAKKMRSDCINIIENGGGCAECIFSKEYPNVAEVDGIKICYDGEPRYSCTIGYPKSWVLPEEVEE